MFVVDSQVDQTVKSLPAVQETWVHSLDQEDLWRRAWQPTSVFLPGEFHGQRRLAGYSPWSRKELEPPTEQLTLDWSLCDHDHCFYVLYTPG